MKIHESLGRRMFVIINAIILVLIALVCIAPMIHTVAASFSNPVALSSNKSLLLWPIGQATLNGYLIVLGNNSIWTGYMNTLIYVVGGTLLGILATTIAAFIFSRKDFIPRNVCMLLISFTMLFNGGMIPTYMVISSLKLVDTRWALILPTAINVFNLVVLRTAFLEIPDSLEEAAKLEGAGDMYYLFRVVVPLAKSTIAVIVLFIAVAQWNAWFQASIYLNSRKLYPLQLILREILIAGNANLTNASTDIASSYSLYTMLIQYSTIVVSTLPILCIYPFLQKYFTKGVMIGAIKG